jgi:hypothetical protein
MTTSVRTSRGMVSSRGSSTTAEFVLQRSREMMDEWQRNAQFFSQISRAEEELLEVFGEASAPDWDGHSARAVSIDAYEMAKKLLRVLPLGTPMPAIGAEPDGQMTLEWYVAPHRTVSVSVSPEGELHYAALFGASSRYGTDLFYGFPPDGLLELVSTIVGE